MLLPVNSFINSLERKIQSMPKPPKEKIEKFITDVVEVDQVFSDGNNDRAVQVFYDMFFPDENDQERVVLNPGDSFCVLEDGSSQIVRKSGQTEAFYIEGSEIVVKVEKTK